MGYYGVLIVGIIISMYFSYERRKGFSANLLILKIISSMSFLLCGYVALLLANSNGGSVVYGATVLFGGIFAICGDIFLDMKGLTKHNEDKYMKCGFVAFMLAQTFYIISIIKGNKIDVKWIIVSIVVSILLAVINILLDKKFQLEYGSYKLIVFIYSAFLITTTVLALVSLITNGFLVSRLLMLIGGILFLISDVILSYTFFKKGCDGPKWYIINHVSYYLAQFAIMSSICADVL